MEKYFQSYLRALHIQLRKFEKHIPHHQHITAFFKSKNARLAVILIIAAAIPLTVLAVQQIQILQQEAASTPKAGKDCTAAAGSSIIASPDAAVEFGKTISFKRASGSFSQDDFDYKVAFGNGINSNSCSFSGGEIANCPTKKGSSAKSITTSSGKTIQGNAHTVTENGASICEYYVFIPANPTKDPNRPSPTPKIQQGTPGFTPKPTATPKENSGCEGNLTASACTADKKPRLSVTWNMKKVDDKPCSVTIGGIKISDTCSATNKVITDLNGKALESGKDYELVLSNSAECNRRADTEKTASCATTGGATATPTPRAGQATNTPIPAQATCNRNIKIELFTDKPVCDANNNTKISGRWDKISGKNCVITLFENDAERGRAIGCSENNNWWTSESIESNKNYRLEAKSDICTVPVISNTIKATACIPPTATPRPGTPTPTRNPVVPGAGTFDPNATPTPCPGGVCP